MIKFENMTEKERNLFGLLDIAVSVSNYTRLSTKIVLQKIIDSGKLANYLHIGWFIACGDRDMKVYNLLHGINLNDKYNVEELKKFSNTRDLVKTEIAEQLYSKFNCNCSYDEIINQLTIFAKS